MLRDVYPLLPCVFRRLKNIMLHGRSGGETAQVPKTKRFVLYSQYRERSKSDRQLNAMRALGKHAGELLLVCIICYLLCIKYSAMSAPENMLRWWWGLRWQPTSFSESITYNVGLQLLNVHLACIHGMLYRNFASSSKVSKIYRYIIYFCPQRNQEKMKIRGVPS